jgi:signal transduction histidine kinase
MQDSVKDEFISTVSHEMRTPLTSIRGFSQTLLSSWDKLDDENKKKFIKIIEEQSNRLIHLVENILTVSKVSAENFVMKKVNINSAVLAIMPIFYEQYKSHKFQLDLDKNLPCALLDEDKIQQVLTNLIDNAAKYSEDGTVVTITTGTSDGKVFIKVRDEGVGIKEEDIPKLFQKFSRLENHLTSKTQGNGLGLYITKQITEKMSGEINVTSKIGEGTTFDVNFKIYDEEEALKCSQKS